MNHPRCVEHGNDHDAITVKIAFLALGAFAIIGMWSAVFADVGVMVIAVLNATRMIQLPSQ